MEFYLYLFSSFLNRNVEYNKDSLYFNPEKCYDIEGDNMLLKDKMTSITLTRVEQDIVDYLLSHQSLLHKLSTRDIAKKVYCSSSALIRLAHKLGFQGYSQLKEQLIKEQEYLDSHFDHIDANIPFTEYETMMGVVEVFIKLFREL